MSKVDLAASQAVHTCGLCDDGDDRDEDGDDDILKNSEPLFLMWRTGISKMNSGEEVHNSS